LTPYSAADKASLAKRYTPAQLAALEAGEASISPDDIVSQGNLRIDHMSLRYLDDFSTIRPVIDHPIRNPESNYDPDLREKTDEELDADFAKFYRDFDENTPEEEVRLKFMQFTDNLRLTVGKEEAERAPRSYLNAPLPKINDPGVVYPKTDAHAPDPQTLRLSYQTGFDQTAIRKFRTKLLVRHRVVNQTRMGKRQSTYCMACAGDGNGLLGIGEGKSEEPDDARNQALRAAVRNMTAVPRYEGRTIFGELEKKVGASIVRISARPPGEFPARRR
jgi:small subunit ribosomal protein S5